MGKKHLPKITVFHCINALGDDGELFPMGGDNEVVNSVKLPCSSMTKDVFLLRAFESGADAVVVFVCPDKGCRHVEGSIRAKKRVARIVKLLDDIDMDGNRLSIYSISPGDKITALKILENIRRELADMGPFFP